MHAMAGSSARIPLPFRGREAVHSNTDVWSCESTAATYIQHAMPILRADQYALRCVLPYILQVISRLTLRIAAYILVKFVISRLRITYLLLSRKLDMA